MNPDLITKFAFAAYQIVEIDGIPFKQINSLYSVEANYFAGAEKLKGLHLMPLLELAKDIMEDLNREAKNPKDKVTFTEVINRLQTMRLGGGDDIEIFGNYLPRIKQILKTIARPVEDEIRDNICLLFLNSRVSKTWLSENKEPLEALLEAPFDRADDGFLQWTATQLSNFRVASKAKIVDFALNEQSGDTKPSKLTEGTEENPAFF